jgi:lia operon protein LiaG
MKKTLFVILIGLLVPYGAANAQEYKMPVDPGKETKISFLMFPGELTIEGYEGKEIMISTSAKTSKPERAKGLTPVYAGGVDNTEMGLNISKNANNVEINCLLPFTRHASYKVKVPVNVSIYVEKNCAHSGLIKVSSLAGEIEIKACQDVELRDISGPVVVSTVGGSVDVVYKSVVQSSPISITSISGEIDLTLPEKTPANLEIKNMSGQVFTDFELKTTNKGNLKYGGGGHLNAQINGGGVEIKISSISGGVYLRKAK